MQNPIEKLYNETQDEWLKKVLETLNYSMIKYLEENESEIPSEMFIFWLNEDVD